ncbi:MAG: tetratricopeptide repeat protein [Chloroflexi bacterium]|nr:tetratricopeptide repeat protein [Chloroflexota bacterium]
MPSDFIVDVTEHNFEYEVLSYSENTPVVVEFWATWCQPCKYLGPILERLAAEAGGEFRLARVDVDASPNLALRFGVRSVPTVKAISQGQVVGEFAGAQPEARVREFLARLAPPSESALAKEKADSLLLEHRWEEAEQVYRELDEQAQSQPGVLLGLAKSLLAQGKCGEALFILNYFPASREFQSAEVLRPLAESMMKYEKGQLPDETDLDAMFRRSIHLAMIGNHPAALDGLLEIIRQDKRYRNDIARQVFLAILDILGPADPDSRQYRAELTSLLF